MDDRRQLLVRIRMEDVQGPQNIIVKVILGYGKLLRKSLSFKLFLQFLLIVHFLLVDRIKQLHIVLVPILETGK